MFDFRIRLSLLVFGVTVGPALNSTLGQHHEGHSHSDPKEKPAPAPKCPVMDDPVNFFVKTLTSDGPVYFCCKDCVSKFEANPTKYATKVAEQRKVLETLPRIQVTCPISGKPVDRKVFVEKDGRKTFFCGKNCIDKYQAEPAKYAAALADGYSYQTKCPVSNEDIDPKAFIKLKTGQTIYFCCDMCGEKFLKDPAQYAPKLEAQGLHIDPKKVELAPEPGTKDEDDSHEGHGGHDHDHDGTR